MRVGALATVLSAAIAAAEGAEPGLIVWYTMDHAGSAQTVKDRSGNANHGERKGGSWTGGKLGGGSATE